jgi:hypothetical protein
MNIENLEIIAYKPEFATYFYYLNVACLEKYFCVKSYDKKVLSNPKEFIINTGGFIFFCKI